ncbi:MAG: carbon-nitrogen hydrolase family protein [Acidobacteria bacterium]|nr:carbon-nitrogen hydrolase family protein [Acidobacteriota bacterium]
MNARLLPAGLLPLLALSLPAQNSDKIRLGLFSALPLKWDVETNWRTFQRTFEAHAKEGIDLVVTPECFLDGYAAADKSWTRERFESIAQDFRTSPYLARVRELSEKHRTAILFGYTEKKDGKFYNAALLIDRDGRTVGQYYKTHLQGHDLRFTPGGDLPVFDTAWGKMGVLICADRRWPETARTLRLKGARLTLVPSYGMWHIDNEWWMRTRSYENENFLAFAHPNVAFVSDPKGGIVAKLQTNLPGMLVVDVDLAQVTDTKHLRDRRPELYQDVGRSAR